MLLCALNSEIMAVKKKIRHYVRMLLSTLLFVSAMTGFAQNATQSESGDIDVKGIIFGHIMDSYEWHITEWHGKPVAVYLPVVVWSKQSGFHVFSSKNIEDGKTFENFRLGADGGKYAGKVVEIIDNEEVRPIDISITKNVLGIFFNCAVILVIIMSVARWYRRHTEEVAPGGFRGAIDMFINSINEDVIKAGVGENYKKFAPYLLTVFFFIFFNNLLGLIPIFPAGANITGNIAVTMSLAIFTFIAINLFGTKKYWREILWPDVPLFLKVIPLMPIIELVGIFTKPFALMIRLFANIFAGHTVILGLSCLVFISVKLGIGINAGMTVVSVLFMAFMTCLELLVAYIQAYVFTMLSSVFIGMAQHH